MPIPNPESGESQNDFVSRCMSAMSGDDKPNDQKVAICMTKWRESKKSMDVTKEDENGVVEGFTSTDGESPHYHKWISKSGLGMTIETIGGASDHSHVIMNGKIDKGGPDSHTHTYKYEPGVLTRLINSLKGMAAKLFGPGQ